MVPMWFPTWRTPPDQAYILVPPRAGWASMSIQFGFKLKLKHPRPARKFWLCATRPPKVNSPTHRPGVIFTAKPWRALNASSHVLNMFFIFWGRNLFLGLFVHIVFIFPGIAICIPSPWLATYNNRLIDMFWQLQSFIWTIIAISNCSRLVIM